MNKGQLFVGIITASFGREGWCRLKAVASDLSHFYGFKWVFLRKDANEVSCQVEGFRSIPQGLIIKFKGVESIEAAHLLKGNEMWVDRRYAQKLARGEYYIADLQDSNVFYQGRFLGRVTSTYEGAAQCLLEVTLQDGKQRLIPFIKHFIKEVRPTKKIIELNEDYILQ